MRNGISAEPYDAFMKSMLAGYKQDYKLNNTSYSIKCRLYNKMLKAIRHCLIIFIWEECRYGYD